MAARINSMEEDLIFNFLETDKAGNRILYIMSDYRYPAAFTKNLIVKFNGSTKQDAITFVKRNRDYINQYFCGIEKKTEEKTEEKTFSAGKQEPLLPRIRAKLLSFLK